MVNVRVMKMMIVKGFNGLEWGCLFINSFSILMNIW